MANQRVAAPPREAGSDTAGESAALPTPAPRPDVVLLAVAETDREQYLGAHDARLCAHTTLDATRLMRSHRPRVVIVDWDEAVLDGAAICRAARELAGTAVLVLTGRVDAVPGAIKAGCHSVLLKPCTPALVAARVARLLQPPPAALAASAAGHAPAGTNRACFDVTCPRCGTEGAVSFDFSSHRRVWYACLSCESTWLGPSS